MLLYIWYRTGLIMKYSKLQLKIMADIVLDAKKNNDWRYIDLVVILMTMTGLTEQQVEAKIQEFADYENEWYRRYTMGVKTTGANNERRQGRNRYINLRA